MCMDTKSRGIFVAFEESPAHVLTNAAQLQVGLRSPHQRRAAHVGCETSRPTSSRREISISLPLLAGLSAKIKTSALSGWPRLSSILCFCCWTPRKQLARSTACAIGWNTRCRPDHHSEAVLRSRSRERRARALQFRFRLRGRTGPPLSEEVSLRSLRVLKYRGPGFSENAFPMLHGSGGVRVAGPWESLLDHPASKERVLGAENDWIPCWAVAHRGSGVCITGLPRHGKVDSGRRLRRGRLQAGAYTLHPL